MDPLKVIIYYRLDQEHAKTVIFLGEKGSGKSTLITSFNGAEAKAAPKTTVALQFSFAKKKSDLKKEQCNLYELGGG